MTRGNIQFNAFQMENEAEQEHLEHHEREENRQQEPPTLFGNRSTNVRSTWGEDERSQVQIDKLPNLPEVTDDMDIGGDANLDASNASSGNTVVVVEETPPGATGALGATPSPQQTPEGGAGNSTSQQLFETVPPTQIANIMAKSVAPFTSESTAKSAAQNQ